MFTRKQRPMIKSGQINKKSLRTLLFIMFITILTVLSVYPQDAGQKIFETKCFSCHNVGGGNKQGPDLKGVTEKRSREWLAEFTKSPTAMSKKDSDAAALFKEFAPEVMPDQTLTEEELDSIINMIKTLSASNEMFTPSGAKLSRAIRPGDVREGWRYFTGQKSFQNGGVSCNSCHSIDSFGSLGGGTLGPNLTAANKKYRDPELILILQNPNFPTMTEMFRDHKLTDEEIVQVFAYLQNSKSISPHAQVVNTTDSGSIEPRFLVAGFAITLLSLFGLNMIWRKRHGDVREDLVRRSKI